MYNSVFSAQNGVCAICKRAVKGNLSGDHEHSKPPRPRGLLCRPCNSAIGLLQDSSEIAESAAAYLRKYGK